VAVQLANVRRSRIPAVDVGGAQQDITAHGITSSEAIGNAAAQIAFRSIVHTGIPSAVTTWEVSLPSGIVPGDLLIVQLGSDRNTPTTVTSTPTGWATIPGTTNPTIHPGTQDCLAFYYYKWLQAGDPELSGTSPVWTFASASAGAAIMASYIGTDPTNPIDTAASSGTLSGTSHVTSTITTSVANCMIVGGVIMDKSGSTSPGAYYTPPGSWDERIDIEESTIFVESTFADIIQSASGAISGTFTSFDGDASVEFIVALRPPGGLGTHIIASGIPSSEQIGSSTVAISAGEQTITAHGISSFESLGNANTASVSNVDAHGIASSESVGSPTVTTITTINANGISSSERVGGPALTTTVNVAVNGIPTSETLGNPSIVIITAINAGSIPSAEGVGSPAVTTTYTIAAHGIPSSEQSGNSNIATASSILAQGIPTSERVGSPTITTITTIAAHGILTSETLGNDTVSLFVTSGGIASSERVGSPTFAVITAINAGSIFSEERFGAATVTTTYTVQANGIPSAEKLGSPSIAAVSIIAAGGITPAEKFGAPTVTPGAVTIAAGSISSSERVGSPDIQIVIVGLITAHGIPSSERVGMPFVGPTMYVDTRYHSPSSPDFEVGPQVLVATVGPQTTG